MSTFLNTSFFSQKDVATLFLKLDDVLSTGGKSVDHELEELLKIVARSEQELQEWELTAEKCYHEAFEKSGKIFDMSLEKQNSRELKNVARSNESLRLFCNLLEGKTDPDLTDSVRRRQITASSRELKVERKKLSQENLVLVSELISKQKELLSAMSQAHDCLMSQKTWPSQDKTLMEATNEKQRLSLAIAEAEAEGMRLLMAKQQIENSPESLQETIDSEKAEIATLNHELSLEKEHMVSRQANQVYEEEKHRQVLSEMQNMLSFLEKIGGTEFQELTSSKIVLKIRHFEKQQEISYQVKLFLDAESMLVRSCTLNPEASWIKLQSIEGMNVYSALFFIRSALLYYTTKM